MAHTGPRPESENTTLWTTEELEMILQAAAPPMTPDVVLKTDPATTNSSPSGASEPEGMILLTDVTNLGSTPDDGELDAVSRRIRRTEIERLSRRRRQATLRAMRDEVRALEAKFAGLMEGHAVLRRSNGKKSEVVFDSDGTTSLDDDDDASLTEVKFTDQVHQLRERFIELKLCEGDLEKEQKDLHRSLRGKQLLALSIQSVAFSTVRTWSDPEEQVPSCDLQFQHHSPEEYARLMRGAYDELLSLEATTTFDSLGSNCLGWSDRRAVSDRGVVFSLTKTFVGREVEPILLESWDVFSSESRLRESFGSWGIHVQLSVLDRPSDDILVIHRSNIRKGCKGERRYHVVFLLFRVRTADGFTLCMRSIPSLQTELDPTEHWTGIFTWLHFREITSPDGSKNCQVVYNNYIPYRNRRRPLSDIFIAFLSTVVRWENACVAGRLLTAL